MIKGVLFDLDGTLANTQEDIADSMNKVLSQHNFPKHNYAEYKYLVGKGLKKLVENSLPENERDITTISICLKEMQTAYKSNCINKTALYPGIFEMLKKIESLNIPIVVFSNKDHNLTKIVCNYLLEGIKITEVLGYTDRFPRKPDPAGVIYLSTKLGVSPKDIIYIGDTDVDMQCANRGNMIATGVLWGFRTEKELIENGAAHIAKKPSDIISIIVNENNSHSTH
jgi:phosphoglycolate phosphatase